jgi:hypothetical protein
VRRTRLALISKQGGLPGLRDDAIQGIQCGIRMSLKKGSTVGSRLMDYVRGAACARANERGSCSLALHGDWDEPSNTQNLYMPCRAKPVWLFASGFTAVRLRTKVGWVDLS